ncbi:hypothetical protein RND71_044245 [Anisodus tanguticus]|uniref:26S proteasome regulatory subunit 4 homolog n=1 Tax=Anisodus tanguticus TaxID=243964 RepID=A0AAE1QNR5_9SOLA|nr:hypothetical protein RND71_044245 [Anisodus tanguticus]
MPIQRGRRHGKRGKGPELASKLPLVTPHTRCRLKLIKMERILDWLIMEEEFLTNCKAYASKIDNEDENDERSKVDDLRGNPMSVGNLEEIIDDNHAIVSTSVGSEHYVSILSFVDKEQLEPNCSVLMNHKVHSVVGVLSDDTDPIVNVMKLEKAPQETYADIGGLDQQIQEIKESVELPLTHPEYYEEMGIRPPKGVILYGPPGTGKTLLAKAVANQTSATFLRVVGSELIQKYLGDGPKLVRELFRVAEEHAPSIVFIDEIDAIGTKRYDSNSGGEREIQRTMLELLNQLDGFDSRGDVKVVMATNRIETLDPALIRPGRIDRKIEFPLPDEKTKRRIFTIHTSRMTLAEDVNFDDIVLVKDDLSGADIKAICTEAGKEVVDAAFTGYNACIFAYGQTGSGKTYTMMGNPEDEGLIPRICQELFRKMQESKQNGSSFRTEVSYLEIYNEKVKDLLNSKNGSGHGTGLKVREHPKTGPYVQDLTKHLVTDYTDVQELMARGNANRTTASTNMNDTSSRSHAIFTVTFSQASFDCEDTPRETLSKLNLVDLAGSERANATGATGQRLLEGAHINKSLVTLGSVIKALAGSSSNSRKSLQSSFIPYRDSVLTWLLKDSLGGNSKTIMISTISPADVNYGETLSTLRYSNRAKDIINKPTINEDSNTRLIRDLRSEIERLKSLIVENPNMIEKVHENEAKVKLLTEEWTEKWKETHRILSEQRTLGLRKAGIGIVLDSDRPHLIGIDDNLLSTGITLYHLNEGITKIGTEYGNEKQDILLNGVDVEDEHCLIELTKDDEAFLIPLNESVCYVNTIRVYNRTKITQGCVISLGRNNMFRFNDPQEVNRLRMDSSIMSGSNGEFTNTQVNLSRVFSQSSDLAKSIENIWTQMSNNNNVDYSDLDLEEKRKEIEELEEEHKRAEERRKEEENKADEALRRKRAELCMLKDESETLHKLIEDSIKRKEETEAELKKLNEQRDQYKQLANDNSLNSIQKLDRVNSTELISIELDDEQDNR